MVFRTTLTATRDLGEKMSDFSDALNKYIEKAGCTASELSKVSGVSKATLSRYHSGMRIPSVDDENIEKLSDALSKYIKDSDKTTIYEDLKSTLAPREAYENLSVKLNELISALDINVNDLSKSLSFDASYISRIRTGKRRPSDPNEFISSVCTYVDRHFQGNDYVNTFKELLGDNIFSDETLSLKEKLRKWFSEKEPINPIGIESFLHKLNDFDLEEYIKVIKFDKLKVPNFPLYPTLSRTYYGLKKMKQGELDFFKSTVLSKSMEDVFMYSNMPMDDMAKDMDFNKKWMFGIAMSLKKGLRLNIIHNLNRPFNELLLGLEAWIPIYMTGQVSPYHIPGKEPGIVNNLLYVSGACSLSGSAIKGHHGQGKYSLYGAREDVKYHRKQSEYLLKMAKPLMEIYTEENHKEYLEKYGNIKLTPPKDRRFYETFNNIKIGFLDDTAVFIHKEKSPCIDFVIRHPKLINALMEFVPPVSLC